MPVKRIVVATTTDMNVLPLAWHFVAVFSRRLPLHLSRTCASTGTMSSHRAAPLLRVWLILGADMR